MEKAINHKKRKSMRNIIRVENRKVKGQLIKFKQIINTYDTLDEACSDLKVYKEDGGNYFISYPSEPLLEQWEIDWLKKCAEEDAKARENPDYVPPYGNQEGLEDNDQWEVGGWYQEDFVLNISEVFTIEN